MSQILESTPNKPEAMSSSQSQRDGSGSSGLDRYLNTSDAYANAAIGGTSGDAHQKKAAEVIKGWNDACRQTATENKSNGSASRRT